MSPLTKTKTPARKSRSKTLPYGLKALPLPKSNVTVGELRKQADDFGKGADWDVIERAYKSRNL